MNRLIIFCVSAIICSQSFCKLPHVDTLEKLEQLYLTSPEAVEKETAKAISSFYKDLKSFLKIPASERTVKNTLKVFDKFSWELTNNFEYFLGLSMVESHKALRESYSKNYQKLHSVYVEALADLPEIYTSLKDLENRIVRGEVEANKEDRYYLKTLIETFQIEGMHLPKDKREKLKQIKLEIIALQESFEKNIREDTSHILAYENQLDGLPQEMIQNLKKNGRNQYALGCDYPTYFTVMAECKNEDVRKALFRAFANRAYPENIAVLHQLLAKRDIQAKLLGYPSYAHMEISTQMAKSPENVKNFLSQMSQVSKKYQNQELVNYKKTVGDLFELDEKEKMNPWDLMYVSNCYLKKTLDLDHEKVKEYFPFDSSLRGLIGVYEKFFDLKISQERKLNLWHEDVITLRIEEGKTNKLLGYLMFDLFPRENKYSHACHCTIIPGIKLDNNDYLPTVSLVIANFSKPTATKPSLLSHKQVMTFFHEFGHAIHAMLGKTKYFGTSGTNTKVDFVELPSQILEEWLWDKDILKQVSQHYKTKKPLPDELIDKLILSRKLSSASFVGRQSLLSSLSLEYHLEGERKDTTKIFEKLTNEMNFIASHDPTTHYQASFGHLREYASRYYGYLWSRVFAADLFEKIKRKGLLNAEVGNLYRKKVLAHGGGKDPSEMLVDFLGREPTQKAFFHMLNLH